MNRRDSALLSPIAEIVGPKRPALPADGSRYDLQTDVIDVLTIGDESTAFRPVQRTLNGSTWVVRHADNLRSAVRLLQTNCAAVAVVEADEGWIDMLSCLRSLPNPPEIVVITHGALAVEDVLSLGAHDLLRRPLTSGDLLWSMATAWHTWMKQLEQREGGG